MANWRSRLMTLWSDRGGYVDPGTGSYFLQMLLAGALGAGFAVKSFWTNIWATISGRKRGKDSPEG